MGHFKKYGTPIIGAPIGALIGVPLFALRITNEW